MHASHFVRETRAHLSLVDAVMRARSLPPTTRTNKLCSTTMPCCCCCCQSRLKTGIHSLMYLHIKYCCTAVPGTARVLYIPASILKRDWGEAAYCCLLIRPRAAELVSISRGKSVQRRLPQGQNTLWQDLSGCISQNQSPRRHTHLLNVYGALILGRHPKLDCS